VSGYLVFKLKNIKEWQTLLQNCSAKIKKIWQQNLALIFPYKNTLLHKIMYYQMVKPLPIMLGTEPGKHIETTLGNTQHNRKGAKPFRNIKVWVWQI
jgi:hypothetical protein